MNNLFLTADQHYGHANILKFCKRPFKDVYEMNLVLIRKYNERVKKDDTCIINGDFAFRNSLGGKEGEGLPCKHTTYSEQLNGNKIFIKGSHDSNNGIRTKLHRLILHYAGMLIGVVHNPKDVVIEDEKFYYPLYIVGHVHDKWEYKEIVSSTGNPCLLKNIGVDVKNFYPVNIQDLIVDYNRWLSKHAQKKLILTEIQKSNLNFRK